MSWFMARPDCWCRREIRRVCETRWPACWPRPTCANKWGKPVNGGSPSFGPTSLCRSWSSCIERSWPRNCQMASCYRSVVSSSGSSPRMSRSLGVSRARTALVPAATANTATKVAPRPDWGWLPALSLVAACGLLIVSTADSLSGSGVQGVEPLFWLGLLVIAAPIAARLLAPRAARLERLGLVLVFGVDLYLVKWLQSPFAFTYSDEFVHLYNANQIFDSARLFSPDALLPVSALYPG